jgi:hypothetical protein
MMKFMSETRRLHSVHRHRSILAAVHGFHKMHRHHSILAAAHSFHASHIVYSHLFKLIVAKAEGESRADAVLLAALPAAP